ncbi:PREDICTED: uncharacterized protein LOC106806976 [Priapulus caudatus]|uniref:Uncharacterized protein LOC106806976 n=1 Tax=Priapulus caudatus TaxID=37621 RepID=A0ABM1DXI4_PRICU|nr:PREDICTED: uncharacterized protein LOC106806976 [Priapulus caudatus]
MTSFVGDTLQGLGLELTRHVFAFEELGRGIAEHLDAVPLWHGKMAALERVADDLATALDNHSLSTHRQLAAIGSSLTDGSVQCTTAQNMTQTQAKTQTKTQTQVKTQTHGDNRIVSDADEPVVSVDVLLQRFSDALYDTQVDVRSLLEMARKETSKTRDNSSAGGVSSGSSSSSREDVSALVKEHQKAVAKQTTLLKEVKSNIYNSKRNILKGIKQAQETLTSSMTPIATSCADNGNAKKDVGKGNSGRNGNDVGLSVGAKLSAVGDKVGDLTRSSIRSMAIMRDSLARNARYLESFSTQLSATFESVEKLRNETGMIHTEIVYAANAIDMVKTISNATERTAAWIRDRLRADADDAKARGDAPCCCTDLSDLTRNLSMMRIQDQRKIRFEKPDGKQPTSGGVRKDDNQNLLEFTTNTRTDNFRPEDPDKLQGTGSPVEFSVLITEEDRVAMVGNMRYYDIIRNVGNA